MEAVAYRKLYNETEFKRFRDTTITVSFTSGECIKTLSRHGADKTIAASYPFKGQRFLLQKEYGGRGFIQLVQDFSCCLRGNESLITTVVEFSDAFGGQVLAESPVTFEDKLVRFDIPKLPHEKVIQLRILQKNTAAAQQATRNQPLNQPAPKLPGNARNNYVGQPDGGIQFEKGAAPAPTLTNPSSSTGTVVAMASMAYSVTREPGTQRLVAELKPVILTEYYFRTSRYDTWAAKLGDRRQEEVEVVLQKSKNSPKLEEGSASFDLTEHFDVFDMGQSSERLDINTPTTYGQAKTSVQYPALLSMQEASTRRTFEGASFQLTNNRWFTTHALPVYQRAIHLQNAAAKVDIPLRSDMISPYRNGRELVRVSAMNLFLALKPPLAYSELPSKLEFSRALTIKK